MHAREPNQVNPITLYRPPCPKCGSLTVLARIEPADELDHDLRTFQCETCDHSEIIKIKYR